MRHKGTLKEIFLLGTHTGSPSGSRGRFLHAFRNGAGGHFRTPRCLLKRCWRGPPFTRVWTRKCLKLLRSRPMKPRLPRERRSISRIALFATACPNNPRHLRVPGCFPHAPQLFVHPVTKDPPGKTFWKTKNGIRLTAMPGFQKALSDQQLCQVTLFLAHGDKLPATVQQTLAAAGPALPSDKMVRA